MKFIHCLIITVFVVVIVLMRLEHTDTSTPSINTLSRALQYSIAMTNAGYTGGVPLKPESIANFARVYPIRREKYFRRKHKRHRFTENQRRELLKVHGPWCYLCGIGLSSSRTYEWDIDHVVPLSEYGDNSYRNCKPTCVKCHRYKTKYENSKRMH